jgi:hypothetical protein
VGPSPDVSYYGVDEMRESERKEFLSWYETVAMTEVFDNRRILESYCQADVAVLRGGVPNIPQDLSTDRNGRSVSQEHDHSIGL